MAPRSFEMSAAVLGLRTVSIEAASIETAIELDAEMSLAPALFTKPRISSLCWRGLDPFGNSVMIIAQVISNTSQQMWCIETT